MQIRVGKKEMISTSSIITISQLTKKDNNFTLQNCLNVGIGWGSHYRDFIFYFLFHQLTLKFENFRKIEKLESFFNFPQKLRNGFFSTQEASKIRKFQSPFKTLTS